MTPDSNDNGVNAKVARAEERARDWGMWRGEMTAIIDSLHKCVTEVRGWISKVDERQDRDTRELRQSIIDLTKEVQALQVKVAKNGAMYGALAGIIMSIVTALIIQYIRTLGGG